MGAGQNKKYILQYCAIFLNRKSTPRREPVRKAKGGGGGGEGNQEYKIREVGNLDPPCSPPATVAKLQESEYLTTVIVPG